MPSLIGNKPNQVPSNGDLGTLAFQDSNAVNITGGTVDVSAGTAALPTLGTTGDPNTGVFFPAADTVAVATNGAERMRIDSAGNVGIGKQPNVWSQGKALQVGTTTSLWFDGSGTTYFGNNFYFDSSFKYTSSSRNAVAYLTTDTGNHVWWNAPSGTAGNVINFTQAMTLDASGNLLVGTTSTAGVTSNNTMIVGGILKTISGSVSAPTTTATTLFSAPSLPNATYILSVGLANAGSAATYSAISFISVDLTSVQATSVKIGTLMTISISGQNIQATQGSGLTQSIAWTATRIH